MNDGEVTRNLLTLKKEGTLLYKLVSLLIKKVSIG